MPAPIEYVETLAKIRETFPDITDERVFDIADRAHRRVVIDPQRLEVAIAAFRKGRVSPGHDEAHAALTTAIAAYLQHDSYDQDI